MLVATALVTTVGCATIPYRQTRPKVVVFELWIDGKPVQIHRKTYLYEDELEKDDE